MVLHGTPPACSPPPPLFFPGPPDKPPLPPLILVPVRYVGEKDLAFFKYHAMDAGACPGASAWEVMFQKDLPGFVRYTAWRRILPSGITEYKSVTTCPNATAQEFMDMYLDDDFRRNWDGMVIHHEVLEHGEFSQRQQVVRWVRRFPFSFLSDREYTIARRVFHEPDGSIVACTKVGMWGVVLPHSGGRRGCDG